MPKLKYRKYIIFTAHAPESLEKMHLRPNRDNKRVIYLDDSDIDNKVA